MTFDECKQVVKDYCNLSSSEADTRVGNAIRRHYQRVTSKIGMDTTRFTTVTGVTVAGTRTVTFTSIEKIDLVLDVTETPSIQPLEEKDRVFIRSLVQSSGRPCQWAAQANGSTSVTVIFDVTPDAVYDLQADGWAPASFLTGNDIPEFAESYHDILTWSVIAEELLKKEKADLSDRYQAKADQLLEELVFHYADSPTRKTRQRDPGRGTGRDPSVGIQ